MLRNTESSYGFVSKFFHWTIFTLIVFMFGLGWYMTGLELSPRKLDIYFFHKSLGILILTLVFLRLLWRVINISPLLPETTPIYQKLAAHGAHWLLYLLMLAIPVSGWLMSSAKGFPVKVFGTFTLPDLIKPDNELGNKLAGLHEILGIVFLVILGLHIGAALYHHFILKDDILTRMLPWKKRTKK